MGSPAARQNAPALLVCGDDEFGVKQRARAVYAEWTTQVGGMDHEVIDASVSNSSEALKALARLRESLQTFPFFGSAKVVWLQNCSFLGDERAATSQVVTEALAALAAELKAFAWEKVRLLVSAGKVDKRKVFYKTLEKIGMVETFAGWSIDDRDWSDQAEAWARKALREAGKRIDERALAELVNRVGPNQRQLSSEVEKLGLYVGDRTDIGLEDVEAVSVRNKSARAFALGEALGDRDLPRLLRCLDEGLWEARTDPQKSEIGLLYGLISKVRSLLLLQELLRQGWVKSQGDYTRFKAQLAQLPAEQLPRDKRYNPAEINPYVLFKCLPQVRRYSQAELVQAMDILLRCNQQLVSSGREESLVLQQALVQIVRGNEVNSMATA